MNESLRNTIEDLIRYLEAEADQANGKDKAMIEAAAIHPLCQWLEADTSEATEDLLMLVFQAGQACGPHHERQGDYYGRRFLTARSPATLSTAIARRGRACTWPGPPTPGLPAPQKSKADTLIFSLILLVLAVGLRAWPSICRA